MLGPIINTSKCQTKSLVHKCHKVYYTDAENKQFSLFAVKAYVALWVQVVLDVHLLEDFDIVS